MPDSNNIDVSVVMSVFNGADYLEESIESVLSQKGVKYEFIIINDGSTDSSRTILEAYAGKDKRIRLFHQINCGLTKALISGCEKSRGKYIARQDCGDCSLPDRLKLQKENLDSNKGTVLLSCWSEAIGPDNEFLFVDKPTNSSEELTKKINSNNLKALRGVSHHGSVMFRRNAYKRAGGYRSEFYYAQDLDLWRRITAMGELAFIPKVLYRYRILPESLSGTMSREQQELTKIIISMGKTPNSRSLLRKASKIKPLHNSRKKLRMAQGNYFIGRLLELRSDDRSKKYYKKAIHLNVFHLKSWIRLMIHLFLCKFKII